MEQLLNANLRKDLHDNEEICEHCHGTGMVIANNPYGLRNDPDKTRGYFPYQQQSISFCPHCYNGIVHRCKLCGQIMPKGALRHNCEQQSELNRKARIKKETEELQKAPIAPKEVEEGCPYLYSEDYPYNDGFFSDWDDFFDSWVEEHKPNDMRPEFVWITEPVEMHIDAQSIIEDATQDLYDGADEDVHNEARKELQYLLDNWCKHCGVGTTYYESHKYKVRIPWEEY